MAQDQSIFSDKLLSQLPLSEWLVENCRTMGMTKATKVQVDTIPLVLKGKDVVVRAKTGSGKTAAFALPILEHLSADPYGIFALVLTPTRELACQIGDQFIALSANTGFRTAVVYGGSGYITNTGEIEDRPHILIATPGRLADVIRSGMEFDVSELKYLVVDEADQLLCNDTFEESLKTIFEQLPSQKERQTLLFSATLDRSIQQIYNVLKYENGGEDRVVFVESDSQHQLSVAANIQQMYCFVPEMTKETYLVTLCRSMSEIQLGRKSVMIFVSSKEYCMIMARLLRQFELNVSELHGNLKQKQRLKNLLRFKSGISNILICTDVASRGLDISQVEYVINFDIPRSGFEYVHRIGRCGRVDRCGTAITFVSQYDVRLLQHIERHIQHKLKEFKAERKYGPQVAKLMERVLVMRAGIINSVETKFLMDPYAFKHKHSTLKWDGKFRDPRLCGGDTQKVKNVGKKKVENVVGKSVESSNANQIEANQILYQDFRKAFDTEFDDAKKNDMDETQQQKSEVTEKRFYADLKQKEKRKKRKERKKQKDEGMDMDMDREETGHGEQEQAEDMDRDAVDANLNVIDEEVRLKNMEQMQNGESTQKSKVGQDFHTLSGWQSFRYGKNAQKIKRMERIERAKLFQMKRIKMEMKKSKRERRPSELDLFSIYEKKRNIRAPVKTSKRNVWSARPKPVSRAKKVQLVKLSKGLRKSLSETEQHAMMAKKREWFKGGDMQWS